MAEAKTQAKTQAVATPNISSAALPVPNPTLTISAEYPAPSYNEDAIISPTSGSSSHGHFHLKDFHADLNSLDDEIGDISENELNKVVTDDDSDRYIDGYIGDLRGPQEPPNASPLYRTKLIVRHNAPPMLMFSWRTKFPFPCSAVQNPYSIPGLCKRG